MKFTNHTLKKIEQLYKELGYTVRYGKGNFQAGACILDEKNIVVVNKFFDIEARINSLSDILNQLNIDDEKLTDASLKTLKSLQLHAKPIEE